MVTEGWVSITSALDRAPRWPVDYMCSARADAATFPLRSACQCLVK